MKNLQTYKKFESQKLEDRSHELLEYFFDLEDELLLDVSCSSHTEYYMGEVKNKYQVFIKFPKWSKLEYLRETILPKLGGIHDKIVSIGEFKPLTSSPTSKQWGGLTIQIPRSGREYIYISIIPKESGLNWVSILEEVKSRLIGKSHSKVEDVIVEDIYLHFTES